MIQLAERNGFQLGRDEGARDAYEGGYRPEAHRSFHDTPGYDPGLGPFGPYREAFRRAYLRGYERSFNRR